MYHAASIQLMQAYLWKGISAQHVLYLLGGLSVVPARFCADSEICIGTDAHNKVKGLLPLASLNKCLHDLAKEHKVAPMVVECVNCEYYCHEGDANLTFDEELSDIKISLRLQNKLHHMLCPDVLYYGSRMVQVSPLDHDGSGDNITEAVGSIRMTDFPIKMTLNKRDIKSIFFSWIQIRIN